MVAMQNPSSAWETPVSYTHLDVYKRQMLYLAMMDITKKWTGRRQDWSLIHAQMSIYFAERMPE